MKSIDSEIADGIKQTTEELARSVVRNLANELADVVDIIEPALSEHIKRLRQARMASVDEIRQIATAIRELSDTLLAPKTEQAIVRAERLLAVISQLVQLKASGGLNRLVRAFDE